MFLAKLGRILIKLLKKVDLFPTDQFVRYNSESEYTTATGGLVSLVLIIIILILFSNKGIQTLDRTTITSSVSTQIETDPSPIKVVTSPNGGFMFAVGMFNLNLNDPLVTYFNISLFQNYYGPLWQVINYTQVPLVQCTSEHFNFNEETLGMYYNLGLANTLCPPLDYVFEVGGRMTSDVFSQFNVYIEKCNSTLTTNCANDTVMQPYGGSFTFTIPIVNTIVNPNDQEYVHTYIEDRNYFTFSSKLGVTVNADIARYQIDTDKSIMPYEEIVSQQINTVPNLLRSSSFQITGDFYGSVTFSKSIAVTTFTRSFSKLDNFVSYIGGFIGAALVLFFLLRAYSEKSFLVEVGSQLFRDEEEGCTLTRFSFFDNMAVAAKRALNTLRIPLEWKRGEFLGRAMEEAEAQIDVALLLRRVAFVEEAVSVLFAPHQLHALHLRPKRLLREAEQHRDKYNNPFDIENFQQKTVHSIKNIEENSSETFSTNGSKKQQLDKIKTSFEKVLFQSNQGNLISRRIIQKLNPNVLQKNGSSQTLQSKIIQLKQRGIKNLSASNHELNLESFSKNAVFNEFEDIPNPDPKQDFVFQYAEN